MGTSSLSPGSLWSSQIICLVISNANILIFITCKQFHASVVQTWYYFVMCFFTGLGIDITTFNKKITIYFQVLKLPNISQRQDALPIDIYSIGWPISDNWETNTWVQSIPFSRNPNLCPFNLLFPSCWMNFTALVDSMYQKWGRGGGGKQ